MTSVQQGESVGLIPVPTAPGAPSVARRGVSRLLAQAGRAGAGGPGQLSPTTAALVTGALAFALMPAAESWAQGFVGGSPMPAMMYPGGQPMGTRGMGGPRPGSPDFDWDNIEGGGDDDSGGFRGRGRINAPVAMRTELGKAIQRLQFNRDPSGVLTARTSLARKLRSDSFVGPPTPDAPGGDGAAPTDNLPPGMAEMLRGMPPEMMDQIDPAELSRMAAAMSAAGSMQVPGGPPAGDGDDDAPAPGAAPAEGAGDAPPSPAGLLSGMPFMPGARNPAATRRGAAGGGAAGGLSPEQQKLERESKQKRTTYLAERFRLLVVGGDWTGVREFLTEHGGEDRKAIYDHVLSQLSMMDEAVVPEEVLAIADASPQPPTNDQLTQLGQLLANTARRGGEPRAVAAKIREGTIYLGGPDGGAGDEVAQRVVKRKRAAALFMGAGLPVEAQAYLPPLERARELGDAELLNLHALYFDARARKLQGQEREENVRRAWDLALEVLGMEGVKDAPRGKALGMAMRLITQVEEAVGDKWLDGLFTPRKDAPPLTLPADDIGWMVLSRAHGRSKRLLEMQAPPEVRLKSLGVIGRVGRSVLRTTKGPELARWGSGLDMVTMALLAEAETTRNMGGGRAGGFDEDYYDPYGGGYDPYGQGRGGRQRFQPIAPEDLAKVLPDQAWLLAIDPGLAAKLEVMVATTQVGSGDVKSVLALLTPVAKSDPARGAEMAEAIVKAWPSYVRPGGDPLAMMYGRGRGGRFGGFNPWMYGGYNPYGNQGSIPLTRQMQARHLQQLKALLAGIEGLGLPKPPAPVMVDAFSASHSMAEVYRRDDLLTVFGAPEGWSDELRLVMINNMRQRLGTVWRSMRVQQQAGTNRTDPELAREVVAGYDAAIAMLPEPAAVGAGPKAWEVVLLRADLHFDKAEYLYGQRADLATYSAIRERAFALYGAAAERYAVESAGGRTAPNARAFVQWFNAALGASDLGFLTRQDMPDTDQVAKVRQALDKLGDRTAGHVGLFAVAITRSLGEVSPELKVRYATHAARVVGDAPEGRDLRKALALYEDIQKEVELALTVDGPAEVGRGEAFGAVLSVRATRSVSRESGGFAKYLQTESWDQMTGQQTNPREAVEKMVRDRLAERFHVVSITWDKPGAQPLTSTAQGRQGWEETPMAYVLLRPRDASVDTIPPLQMDMDFRDSTGTVLLPVSSSKVVIDAKGDKAPVRPVKQLAVEMVLDDRPFNSAKVAKEPEATGGSGSGAGAGGGPGGVGANPAGPNAAAGGMPSSPGRGEVVLEVNAKGRGLIGPLDSLVNLDAVRGFRIVSIDDTGNNVESLDASAGVVTPVTERNWKVRLRSDAAVTAAANVEFRFPTLRPNVGTGEKDGSAPKLTMKRYSDADVVETASTVALATSGVPGSRAAWLIAAAIVTVAAVLGVLAWRRGRRPQVATVPLFTMPRELTPITTIATLRKLHAANGSLLSATDHADLGGEITRLEQRWFAPEGHATTQQDGRGEMERVLRRWLSRVKA